MGHNGRVLALEILVGLLVGALLGALGAGGGVVAVPALIFLLGQTPQQATTASLIIVALSAAAATVQHARGGHVQFARGTTFALLGSGGAVLGARVNTMVPSPVVLLLLAVLLVVVAYLMWMRSRDVGAVDTPPTGATQRRETRQRSARRPWQSLVRWRSVLLLVSVASGVGLLTGFFGVGGGFAVVPAMVMVLRLPMREAVATSVWVVSLTSLVGLAARWGTPVQLDWGMVAVFAAAAVLASVISARLSRRLPAALLGRAFAAILVLIAGYTVGQVLWG